MPTTLTLAMLSNDVYSAEGTGAGGYRRLHGLPWLQQNGDGFFGACYTGGTTGVVAFRGSLELLADWCDADIDIARGRLPIDQIGDAFSFFSSARNALAGMKCTRVVVTGHSLGGALAQLVAARVSSFPVVGVTFNAPGAKQLRGAVRIDSPNERHVHNYRAEWDLVSKHGQHLGRTPITIKNAGAHPIGPLIEALARTAEGAVQH